MGFKETLGKMIGIEEQDETITEEEIEREKEKLKREEFKPVTPSYKAPSQAAASHHEKAAAPQKSAVSNYATAAFKLVVIEPKSFDECPKLVDSLKGRRPVIINLENIETETAKKIFDFLSGATYALNGGAQKIASNIFIFAPESVDIASNQDEGFAYGKKPAPGNWSK